MLFIKLHREDDDAIAEMSQIATSIVKEHFDPLIGSQQNDYMISLFQTKDAIKEQLENGYQYYFVQNEDKIVGFIAFYPKQTVMYLSKFYLYKDQRKKGYSHQMLDFIIEQTKKMGFNAIELNVNKHNSACEAYDHLGFKIIRSEKNDIGNGYYMDDYVYRLDL